jgi:hypothetical protein
MLYIFEEHKNRWTSFAYDKEYGYYLFVIQGKRADVYAKSADEQILEQFTVIR